MSSAKGGETIDIEVVIESHERVPLKDAVIEALRELRRDKVKGSISAMVKAAKFDRRQAVEDFLIDGNRGPRGRQ